MVDRIGRRMAKRPRLGGLVYKAALAVDGGRPAWHYRIGWVHEKAGDWASAAETYRHALARIPDRADWHYRLGWALERGMDLDAAADAYRAAIAHPDHKAAWHYRLGRTLEQASDWHGAAAAYRAAIAHGEPPTDWHHRLGVVCEKAENHTGAADAYRAGILTDEMRPSWRYRLAALHNRTGQWREAAGLLEDNIARHPDHAASHRLLARVEAEVIRWGGTFEGPLDDVERAEFRPKDPGGAGYARAVAAMDTAVALKPSSAPWRFELGRMCELNGDLDRAVRCYEQAISLLDKVDERWVFKSRQSWQFRHELTRARAGDQRVDDPLFECRAVPAGSEADEPAHRVGLFAADWVYSGLRLSGLVLDPGVIAVDIMLDDVRVKRVNVATHGFFPRFMFAIRRPTLERFPSDATLSVISADGRPLTSAGATALQLRVPHGDGSIFSLLKSGGKIDKKGSVQPTRKEIRTKQRSYLDLYSEVREFFHRELGRPLLVLYGTLLGFHREGDLIPGDDDFDTGYVSRHTDPLAVKEECKDIIRALVRAGFTVSFNRAGRLCRVGRDAQVHLDLRPIWFEDGRAWLHKHACLDMAFEDFLPAGTGTLHGHALDVPRHPEVFLRAYYGPGWTTPDPGYSNSASAIDPEIIKHLNRLLVSPSEYRAMSAELMHEAAANPAMGRFEALGLEDLYPLDSRSA